MKASSHKRPPQGAARIFSEKVGQDISRRADNIADSALLSVSDPDISALREALYKRDDKTAGALLKILKPRYGKDWPEIALVIRRGR